MGLAERWVDGGLYFTSAAEFAGALDWLLDRPETRRRMGASGQACVQRQYSGAATLQRFREAMTDWSA